MTRKASTEVRALTECVKRALGPRARTLTPSELRQAVARFRKAGALAVASRWGGPSAAAKAMDGFKTFADEAAQHLADTTAPGHPPLITDPAWRIVSSTSQANRNRLIGRRDVMGHALGVRIVGGKATTTPCLTIAVARKRSLADLRRRGVSALPRSIRAATGQRIPVDVVEAGEITLLRQITTGESLGPFDRPTRGTLGAFAVSPGRETVALTAMHVVEPPSDGIVGVPSPALHPGSTRLGALEFGTRQGVDAAAVTVDPQHHPLPTVPGIGPVRGWRPVIIPGDRSKPVSFFGTTSGLQRGFIVEPAVTYGNLRLHDLILVDIEAAEGDSGAGLLDSRGLLLGLLVGRLFWLGVPVIAFSPMSLVLEALGRTDVLKQTSP